ncbi:MAG: AEC family transporter [Prevotellaceae bacterium]|jgi:predicted permease|nr:AEC family transporter [Prevotellaceae bacterium]
MSPFLFSLNCVLPIFLIIVLGWALRQWKIIIKPVADALNTIAFNVTLPLLLFRDIAIARLQDIFSPAIILYAIAGTVLTFGITWFFAERFIKDRTAIGSFVQGSYRGNYAIIGLFLIVSILGHTGKGALITAFAVPLYNILAVIILSVRSKNPQKVKLRETLRNIIKNPLIIGIIAGLPFSIFEIPLFSHPQTGYIASTIDYLVNITNPIALLAIGASISVAKLKLGLPKALTATMIKIVVSPAIFTGIAYWMREPLGFSGEDLLILFIMFGVPTAVASFIMASKMNNDESLAANIILLSSVLSVLTLTFGIYLFKSAGLIQ